MGRLNRLTHVNKVAFILMPKNIVLGQVAVDQVRALVEICHALKTKAVL
jgi:hypothetical protein